MCSPVVTWASDSDAGIVGSVVDDVDIIFQETRETVTAQAEGEEEQFEDGSDRDGDEKLKVDVKVTGEVN